MGLYLGSWSDKQDVARDFSIDVKALAKARVIIAWYGQGDYCGSAFVLFSEGGKLYEVHGSHCSCMGLEGQWSEEETSIESLQHRLDHGYCFSGYDDGGEAKAALQRFVKRRRKAA